MLPNQKLTVVQVKSTLRARGDVAMWPTRALMWLAPAMGLRRCCCFHYHWPVFHLVSAKNTAQFRRFC